MIKKKDMDKFDLSGVALVIIIFGAAIFAFGLVSWVMNAILMDNFVAFPSLKIIGGLSVIALGYIQLELELLRHK